MFHHEGEVTSQLRSYCHKNATETQHNSHEGEEYLIVKISSTVILTNTMNLSIESHILTNTMNLSIESHILTNTMNLSIESHILTNTMNLSIQSHKPCEGAWLLSIPTHPLGLFLLGVSTGVPCLSLSLPVFALLLTLHGSWLLLGARRPSEGEQSGTLRGCSGLTL